MLDRVLSSETFRRSERARSLLAYLVARQQSGEAEKLKGYAIAVDVFGKDAEFDASTDALVRVQAGRLRELLNHYYELEGKADPIRIAVPRGSYVPAYELVATGAGVAASGDALGKPAAAEPAQPVLPQAPQSSGAIAKAAESLWPKRAAAVGQVRLLWGALALVAVLFALFVHRTLPLGDRAVAAAPTETTAPAGSPRSDALPTIRIVTRGDDPAVAGVARHFRAALSGFDTLEMMGGEYAANGAASASEPTGFVLAIAGAGTPGAVSIDLRSLGSGKVLLNRLLSPAQTSHDTVEDEVASIATSVAPVTGVIYGYLEQRGLKSTLVDCLTLSDAYYTDQTPVRHAQAYKCLEKLVAAGFKSSLIYSELAGLQIEARTDHYAYPPAPSEEQAMMFAREAVRLDPTSPYAHRAMGFLYSRRGDTTEAGRWMGKAYELNTYDLSMAASYGYALVYAADYARGAAILQRAVDASSGHPTWWDYTLFMARFMLDDMDAASRATDALLKPSKFHYLAARLVAAHWRGDRQTQASLVNELAITYPKFVADPGATMRKANYPAALTEKLVGALRNAGLNGSS